MQRGVQELFGKRNRRSFVGLRPEAVEIESWNRLARFARESQAEDRRCARTTGSDLDIPIVGDSTAESMPPRIDQGRTMPPVPSLYHLVRLSSNPISCMLQSAFDQRRQRRDKMLGQPRSQNQLCRCHSGRYSGPPGSLTGPNARATGRSHLQMALPRVDVPSVACKPLKLAPLGPRMRVRDGGIARVLGSACTTPPCCSIRVEDADTRRRHQPR